MGVDLQLGEKIPLFLLLENREVDKVVKATIRKADGTEIPSSPVTVPHLANGEYFLDSLVMPNSQSIMVIYDVFDGPGFTNPSDIFPVDERFGFEEGFDGTQIFAGSDILTGQIESETLTGVVAEATETLSGVINDQENISGEITDDVLAGTLEDDKDTISGKINEDTLDGVLED